jgi:hypothetical protein
VAIVVPISVAAMIVVMVAVDRRTIAPAPIFWRAAAVIAAGKKGGGGYDDHPGDRADGAPPPR